MPASVSCAAMLAPTAPAPMITYLELTIFLPPTTAPTPTLNARHRCHHAPGRQDLSRLEQPVALLQQQADDGWPARFRGRHGSAADTARRPRVASGEGETGPGGADAVVGAFDDPRGRAQEHGRPAIWIVAGPGRQGGGGRVAVAGERQQGVLPQRGRPAGRIGA